MPVKRFKLNGRLIHSLDDFYDQLSKRLDLPDHFGRNLDALWDVFSFDIEGPFEIVWQYADESKTAMGQDFTRLMELFQEMEDERPDFKLKVEP